MAASTAKPDEIPEDGKVAAPGKRKKLIVASAVAACSPWVRVAAIITGSAGKAAEAEKAAQLKKKAFFFDLPEITVNLAGAPGRSARLT